MNLKRILQEDLPKCFAYPIGYRDLPVPAVEKFEGYSSRFVSSEKYRKGDFLRILKTFHEGSEVFLAFQEKGGSSMVYLYGERGGKTEFWGEIGDSLREERPASYLFFIGISDEFRRSGTASRKILFFDAVSRFAFGKPLRSGSSFVPVCDEKTEETVFPVRRIFEKLFLSGEVGAYEGDIEGKGYVFKTRVLEILESPIFTESGA